MVQFFKDIGRSFYFQVVFGISIPILIAFTFLSIFHYQRQQDILMEQIDEMALLAGEQLVTGLNHAMMRNNPEWISKIITGMVSTGGFVDRIQIINLDGITKYDTAQKSVGRQQLKTEPGCKECHQDSSELEFENDDDNKNERTLYDEKTSSLRIAIPVENKAACAQCHQQDTPYLGVVVMDAALSNMRTHIQHDLWTDSVLSLLILAVITIGLYWLLRVLVIKRVHTWREYLLLYATGDFSQRMPVSPDEWGTLAATINLMAEKLEQQERDRIERSIVRENAIAEERERISRELHDGLAQLLGYVSTKAMAVRVNLQNNQTTNAENNLAQLEEVAQNLSVDVREAILGLRTSEHVGDDFGALIGTYVSQFSRLSDISITVSENLGSINLSIEDQLQVLRIIQEALSNARKHALAHHIEIRLEDRENGPILIIEDDGLGFDMMNIATQHKLKFGLRTMRERALSMGATIKFDSSPGKGTRVIINLPQKGT